MILIKKVLGIIILFLLILTNWYLEIVDTNDLAFKKVKTENASLFLEAGISDKSIKPVINSLDKIKLEYFTRNTYYDIFQPEIYILASKESYNKLVFKLPSASTQDSDGVIFLNRMYLFGKSKNFSLQRILVHEYTHHVQFQVSLNLGISDKDLPLWFREGFAEYVSRDETNNWETNPTTLIPLNTLTDDNQFYKLSNEFDTYEMSYHYVYDLIDKFGKDIIEKIMIEYSEVGDFTKAFNNITDIKIDEYHLTIDFSNINSQGNKVLIPF